MKKVARNQAKCMQENQQGTRQENMQERKQGARQESMKER